jgi:hypothetical protein
VGDRDRADLAGGRDRIGADAEAVTDGDGGLGDPATHPPDLERRRFQSHYLARSGTSTSPLGRFLAEVLHITPRRSHTETLHAMSQELRALPLRIILFVDEAHLLGEDALQEPRLPAECELASPPLLTVLLSGGPELKKRLDAPFLFPPKRWITGRLESTGLDQDEVGPFLSLRLGDEAVSGFSTEVLPVIFERTRGIPALVESLARLCLESVPEKAEATLKATQEVIESWEGHVERESPGFPTIPVAEVKPLDKSAGCWLVEGLWSWRAVGVLGGPPKSAKAWTAVDIALSVAFGTKALEVYQVPRLGPVVFFAAEDAPARIRERFEAVARRSSLPLKGLEVHLLEVPTLRLDDTRHQARLLHRIVEALRELAESDLVQRRGEGFVQKQSTFE